MSHTILIAEDEMSLRSALKTKLTSEGFAILEAANGEECVRLAKEHVPDAILLDIIMPRMDGFGALKKLRSDEKTKLIPVVLLTNISQSEDQDLAKNLGVTDYIVKASARMEDIIARLRKILSEGKR